MEIIIFPALSISFHPLKTKLFCSLKQKNHSAGEWVDSFSANFAYKNAPRHLDESQVNRYQRYELARTAFMTDIVYFFSFPDTTVFSAPLPILLSP